MVLTPHYKSGVGDRKAGFCLEEFAAPYYVFKDAGAKITVASYLGGQLLDSSSDAPHAQTDVSRRFKGDACIQAVLDNTQKLGDMDACDFDAVFYPNARRPLWDLAKNAYSINLIETLFSTGKPVGLICYAPSALLHVIGTDCNWAIKGKAVTASNSTKENANNWLPFVVASGLPNAGKIATSSTPAATALVEVLACASRAHKELM